MITYVCSITYSFPLFQDFVLSCVFSVLWLVASCTWTDSVVHLKQYIDPHELFLHQLPECGATSSLECNVTKLPNYAGLHMSLLRDIITRMKCHKVTKLCWASYVIGKNSYVHLVNCIISVILCGERHSKNSSSLKYRSTHMSSFVHRHVKQMSYFYFSMPGLTCM